jgi:hypothetical protein
MRFTTSSQNVRKLTTTSTRAASNLYWDTDGAGRKASGVDRADPEAGMGRRAEFATGTSRNDRALT